MTGLVDPLDLDVRYAHDLIVGFPYRAEAQRLMAELRERLATFGLELHPRRRG